MNKLRLFILLFFVAISIPLAFVVWQTYASLEQEERSQLRYFSDTMFDEMEKELALLVQHEENRAVDEYSQIVSEKPDDEKKPPRPASLIQPQTQQYILGYLQNNPDGSMQTPLVTDISVISKEKEKLLEELQQANRIFNAKKLSISQPSPAPAAKEEKPANETKQELGFAERYLSRSEEAPGKTYLGKKKQRIEEITAEQVYNIASDNEKLGNYKEMQKAREPASLAGQAASVADSDGSAPSYDNSVKDSIDKIAEPEQSRTALAAEIAENNRFEVEVAPFQSVSINDEQVFIFRRIAIDNQIYRQGFILLIEPLLRHLSASHFEQQPLAGFASLAMQRRDQNKNLVQTGIAVAHGSFTTARIFPPPFDFLKVSLTADNIPSSPARNSLNMALLVLTVFLLSGLMLIYGSARTIVAMSERRSQFVSSVTHELKTPLTNIRMYIEMLEQGIAATPEREQEYLAILGSESARLSGLINNVLELAKLEKKQRRFHMEEGKLDDVLVEVKTIMSEKLEQEGFKFAIEKMDIPSFFYDREVLVQILINLIENSIKFGRKSAKREIAIRAVSRNGKIHLSVADSGPGIPQHALKKVFDDFYRVDNDLTRTTGGTGIGLALVKKFAAAMGANVYATNNETQGCTITLVLPLNAALQ